MNGFDGPEIVVGVVTPVGVDTAELVRRVRGALAQWNYGTRWVRLSDLIPGTPAPDDETQDQRLERLIRNGDAYCQRKGSAAAIAGLAVSRIRDIRSLEHKRVGRVEDPQALADEPLERQAYVLHSLKRPAELALLREVYGDRFFVLGLQTSEVSRRDALKLRFSDQTGWSLGDKEQRAIELMNLDAAETSQFGQGVNKTFPEADYFLESLEAVERPIALLFGDHRIAPTSGEHAMFCAYGTSARSLEGSRRVGAALLDDGGAIVSLGANEVPPGEMPDAVRGQSFSEHETREVLADTLLHLSRGGWLDSAKAASLRANRETALNEATNTLSGGRILDLIEFQRPVHAEMMAITGAARRGIPLSDTTLYTTTFPCHLCMKHVLTAGISRVYYIEEYPKSRAASMYESSIGVVRPFYGVKPISYLRLFMERRLPKGDVAGMISPPDPNKALPLVTAPEDLSYFERELEVVHQLVDATQEEEGGDHE